MKLPSLLTFHDADYALDGGSTTLYATDELGGEHRVYLPRNIYSDAGTPRRVTGLLYLDDELVPVRSALESDLMRLFRRGRCVPSSTPRPGCEKVEGPVTAVGKDLERLVRGTPQDNLRWLVDSVISYVASEIYAASGNVPPPSNDQT